MVDKAQGRIETQPFSVAFPAVGGATQVLWVSLRSAVVDLEPQHTCLQAQARVHDAVFPGFMPGPANNPWLDLFAGIQVQLRTW